MKTNLFSLSAVDRAFRIVMGFGLIGVAYFGSGPLGNLALLPLIAIVPLMTATVGECPIEGYLRRGWLAMTPRHREARAIHR